ncbi:universal stress protein [Lysobacter solisilvae (ex Woo and Kim 2020)]|uniref:Universal stress protein n=1 Tax=Agrilutibacter terrestris TaxID=2865112 RepID=A0A7H0FWK4_9GAMM|nr:universal stress protein [Lysobacter terrestris]QNP40420.1 universal stress protein [Lysobacter terrestris]
MDLLVRASRYPEWDPGVLFATRLAGQLRSGLTALHIVQGGIPPVWDYDAGLLLAEYAAAIDEQIGLARSAGPMFEAFAESSGAVFPQWLVAQGHVGDALRYAGNWHDLLVLARDDEDPWATPAALASIALHVDVPCLVVPPGRQELQLECIAIAWNGSIEAIRALHGALPLLRRARRIVLLMGRRHPGLPPVPAPEFALEAWCRRHDFAVEFELLEGDVDDGRLIHEAARAAYADLLVMGAYGRSRFAERVLGGVTRYMLQQTDLPLLMRH